jgi:hypothetical protein
MATQSSRPPPAGSSASRLPGAKPTQAAGRAPAGASPAASAAAARAAAAKGAKPEPKAPAEAKKPAAKADTPAPAPTAAKAASPAAAEAPASPAGTGETGEVKAGEAKAGEAKAGEAKAGEAKTGEAKTGEAKAGEAKAGEAKTGEAKKTRQQMAHILGISISQARCAAHLKKALLDEKTADELARLREAHRKALAEHDASAADLKGQISKLANQVVRLSSDTSIAVAVLWDTAVKELLRFGLTRANGGGRRLMGAAHLHESGVEALTCYPLYGALAAFRDCKPEAEEAPPRDRTAKPAREAKQAARPKAAGAGDDDGDEPSKTSFNTYVEAALKEAKKALGLTALRSAASLRGHVAQLVADGIRRLADLARILVVYDTGARTMTAENVKVVVRLLLTDAGRGSAAIDGVLAVIDEKLEVHRRHLAGEKAKKEALLSPEARAAAEQKAAAAARERTTRQIATAQRRAEEAAKKAAELASRLEGPADEVAA